MAAKNETRAAIEARSIIFVRTFDAPRALVFSAFSSPVHLGQWWGPTGFTTTTHAFEFRPGGVWRFAMHGPDGRDYQNRITFDEIATPERLVYHHGGADDVEPVEFSVTVTLADEGGKTRLTWHMLFPSVAERDRIVRAYGAEEGLKQTVGRLAEHLVRIAAAAKGVPDLVITRVYDAPRELVFSLWTDPKHLAEWWGPRGFTNPVCEADARPGGAMRIHMRAPEGTVYPMTGVFREVVAPERLVFASGALDGNGKPLFEVLTVVTFEDQGGKTRLTLRATVIMQTDAAAPYLAGMDQGWNQSLDRLAERVAAVRGG
ncbi:MAG: SRPBCC domain-containing protein [Stellaceae bacterium]